LSSKVRKNWVSIWKMKIDSNQVAELIMVGVPCVLKAAMSAYMCELKMQITQIKILKTK
jgi:hypothetical protein